MAKWLRHFTATAIFFLVATAGANAPQTELLTYSELQRLSPSERERYIGEVRALLVELSTARDGRFSDSDPAASRSKLKAWLMLLDEARATSNDECTGSEECLSAAKMCYDLGQKLYWDEDHYDCSSQLPRIFIESPGKTYPDKFKLFLSKLPNPKIKPLEAAKVQLSSLSFTNATDERSWAQIQGAQLPLATYSSKDITEFVRLAIERNQPVVRCRSKHQQINIPNANDWPDCTEAQEQKIEAAFKKAQPQRPLLVPRAPPEESEWPVATLLIKEAPLDSKPIALAVEPQKEPSQEPVKPLPPPGIEKRVTAAEIEAALGKGLEQNSVCSKGYRLQGVFKEGEENEFYCMTDAAAAKIERAKSKPIKSVRHRVRCEVPQTACGDPSKDREQIFQGKLPCVIAGMISQLDSRNRRCQPVMSAGDSKCSEQGQSICYPLLFGARPDGSPVCVGRGQSVTKQCAELSSTLDVNRYLASAPAGVQERWDEFKRSLSSLCQTGTVQARFHCAECNVMRQRLAEIHARYGFGCSADSSATGDEVVRSSKSPRRSQKRAVSK
ncbi:MAG: hypothetical protein IPJ84_17735 [Bdellovibrionales bacterium]|nr:hypothetical protein [Bdellovibrionales bacterium]